MCSDFASIDGEDHPCDGGNFPREKNVTPTKILSNEKRAGPRE